MKRPDWLRYLGLRRKGISPERAARVLKPGTYVADVEWKRSEELRVDRLGPGQDDVPNPEKIRDDPWRPRRTLGPIKRR
jgi:hypothetical protein